MERSSQFPWGEEVKVWDKTLSLREKMALRKLGEQVRGKTPGSGKSGEKLSKDETTMLFYFSFSSSLFSVLFSPLSFLSSTVIIHTFTSPPVCPPPLSSCLSSALSPPLSPCSSFPHSYLTGRLPDSHTGR